MGLHIGDDKVSYDVSVFSSPRIRVFGVTLSLAAARELRGELDRNIAAVELRCPHEKELKPAREGEAHLPPKEQELLLTAVYLRGLSFIIAGLRSVVDAKTRKPVLAHVSERTLQNIVMGHSLPKKDVDHITKWVREHLEMGVSAKKRPIADDIR